MLGLGGTVRVRQRRSALIAGLILAAVLTLPSVAAASVPSDLAWSKGSFVEGAYSYAYVFAEGAPAPLFTVTGGALPGGMSLDTVTGVIDGVPAIRGDYTFEITATNPDGFVSHTFSVTVEPPAPPTVVSSTWGSFRVGAAVSAFVSADGLPVPTFAVTAGALPAGLALDSVTGAVTGTPTTAGAYSFTITATNTAGSASASYAGTVGEAPVPPPGTDLLAPLSPRRLLDTRVGGAPVAAGTVYEIQVAGGNGVPADAVAVVLNITATDASGPGFVTAFPCGSAVPDGSSNLNYTAGETIANAITATIGVGGKVCVYTNTTIHLIVDLNGAYTPTAFAWLAPLAPRRLLDTRVGGAPVAAGMVQAVQVAGGNGVPADAVAAVLNVTATDTTGSGFVTVFPCGSAVPDASNLNYATGDTIANAVTATIGSAGRVCLYTSATAHLIVDVNGAFTPFGTASLKPLAPRRLIDTRVGGVPVAEGTVQEVQVAGDHDVPPDAVAAVLNVTASDTTGAGFVTVFPCGSAVPDASNLNYATGDTIANAVTATVGAAGKVCVYASATIHLIVDLNGVFV